MKTVRTLPCSHTVLIMTILCLCSLQGNWCLRDVHLSVPTAVLVGGNITLNCSYTLENESLYTLKYYIGDKELYRFIPQDSPQVHVFDLLEVETYDIKDGNVFVLSGVNVDSTGLYKCEVSTEAPIFFTVVDSAFVTVVVEPDIGPTIYVHNEKVQVGQSLNASCATRGGYPLPNLTWFVDGEQVTYPDNSRITQYTVEDDVDSSVSELSLPIVSASPNGQIHLRCEVSQFNVYNASSVAVVEGVPSSSSTIQQFYVTGHEGAKASVMALVMMTAVTTAILHHFIMILFLED
ncbi:T-lymphocyte activation antigen CD80-like [Homalodisca vitripennis]|uniref:T-lymphocyte activation antigen CD80-like n=1 Tax=Homalodisca vitripennis TaxID=197043 RepID=UPI001EEBB331|nr:T-lymphocyte activation antigen CD80-like [Homalodisca vitripennis]